MLNKEVKKYLLFFDPAISTGWSFWEVKSKKLLSSGYFKIKKKHKRGDKEKYWNLWMNELFYELNEVMNIVHLYNIDKANIILGWETFNSMFSTTKTTETALMIRGGISMFFKGFPEFLNSGSRPWKKYFDLLDKPKISANNKVVELGLKRECESHDEADAILGALYLINKKILED